MCQENNGYSSVSEMGGLDTGHFGLTQLLLEGLGEKTTGRKFLKVADSQATKWKPQ